MPKFAANLSMMFTEVEFLDRFQLAAEAGFKAVEFLFPYEYEPELLKRLLDDYQLELVLFNTAPGNIDQSEWGLAALSGRESEAKESIDQALYYALALDCPTIHMMAGVLKNSDSDKIAEQVFIQNVRYAADLYQKHNIQITLEALSPKTKPHYFYHSQYQVMDLIKRIDRANVWLQFDFFHAQQVDGNIANMLENWMARIRHIQIASVPHRHEPIDGELNYPWLFSLLDQLNYQGWVGCEYTPKTTTLEGLKWLKGYLA